MKRYLGLFLVLSLLFATPAFSGAAGYGATALTGGTTGCLDAINGSLLNDGDKAIVFTATYIYFYDLDASSGAAESSPDIIAPDTNAGTKRWILEGTYNAISDTDNIRINGNTISSTDSNGDINITPDGTGDVVIPDMTATGTVTLTGATLTLDNDQIAVEKIDSGIEGAIIGDGTKGRVIRKTNLTIEDGTNATTIKCTGASIWNGEALPAEDNLGKGGDTGNFTLNAGGTYLTIETGDTIAVLSTIIWSNDTGTITTIRGYASGGNMVLGFYNASSGALIDLTSAVDIGSLVIHVTYLSAP